MKSRSDSGAAQLIMRAVLRLGRRMRAERPRDSVPHSQFAALTSLARQGPMPAARLAEIMRLQPQSLTRLIAALEEDGLIERTRGAYDRRTITLSITQAGRTAVRRDLSARQAWLIGAMTENLTAEEQDLLAKASPLMLRLADAL